MSALHRGVEIVWREISHVAESGDQILAVISYLTSAKALPLKAGDEIVADLSIRSVSQGLSNPWVAEELMSMDVVVYSCDDLHAKAILIGTRLFVGSMNASENSRTRLLEAALETDDRRMVSSFAGWFLWLTTQKLRPLTPRRLEILKANYRPPRRRRGKSTAPVESERRAAPKTWLFTYTNARLKEEEAAAEVLAQGPEQKHLQKFDQWIYESPARMRKRVRTGDLVISVGWENDRYEVWPPAEVWETKLAGKNSRHVFTASPETDRDRVITWRAFKALAKRNGMPDLKRRGLRIPDAVLDGIMSNWLK